MMDEVRCNKESSGEAMPEDEIDETLVESFPGSDPPSWTTGVEPHCQPEDEASPDPREDSKPAEAIRNTFFHSSLFSDFERASRRNCPVAPLSDIRPDDLG